MESIANGALILGGKVQSGRIHLLGKNQHSRVGTQCTTEPEAFGPTRNPWEGKVEQAYSLRLVRSRLTSPELRSIRRFEGESMAALESGGPTFRPSVRFMTRARLFRAGPGEDARWAITEHR